MKYFVGQNLKGQQKRGTVQQHQPVSQHGRVCTDVKPQKARPAAGNQAVSFPLSFFTLHRYITILEVFIFPRDIVQLLNLATSALLPLIFIHQPVPPVPIQPHLNCHH